MAIVTREDVQTVQDDVHTVDGKTTEETKVSEQSLDRERRITKIESWLEESDKRLATKKDVEEVRTEVEKVRTEVGAVRSDVLIEVEKVRTEVAAVRSDVLIEVEKVRTEVRTEAEKGRADMASFKADMRIWLIGAIVLLAVWEDRVAILQWILRVAGGGP